MASPNKPQPIDIAALPDDEAIAILVNRVRMTEPEAKFALAIMRGESDGDIITPEEDNER